VRTPAFIFWQVAAAAALYFVFRYVDNDYIFFASYTVLQFIVLSTAWNILGGYCGYVNFGSAGVFALGAYSSVCLYTIGQSLEELFPESLVAPMQLIFPLPLPVLIIVAGMVAGLVGLGTGYLTLRLRGVFFAIATLALAVVLQTFIVNWSFVGGSRGAYVIPPNEIPFFGPYIQYLFVLMLVLVIISLTILPVNRRATAAWRHKARPPLIPAQAGIQISSGLYCSWIPAGMSGKHETALGFIGALDYPLDHDRSVSRQ
jgi:branched-chain amino acid transport system permease protein